MKIAKWLVIPAVLFVCGIWNYARANNVSSSTPVSQPLRVPSAPLQCGMPQGGVGCCVSFQAGPTVQLDCNAASDCYYRAGALYTDGGEPFVYPDGGGGYAVLGGDNRIPAGGYAYWTFGATQNTVCSVTADGGTFAVSGIPN